LKQYAPTVAHDASAPLVDGYVRPD